MSDVTNKTPIDRIFALPAGAEDVFAYTEDTERTGAVGSDDTTVLDYDSPDGAETTTTTVSDTLDTTASDEPFVEELAQPEAFVETPTQFAVSSQTLRRAPGGQQVVDVNVDVEEVDGALYYEFQVVKL